MFFLPVASMALRKPDIVPGIHRSPFDDRLAWKNVEQLRPDVAAKGFGFHRSNDRGNIEFLRDLCEKRHVVDQRRSLDAGDAEGHLRLVVDEDNSAVFGSVEFVVSGSWFLCWFELV